MELKTRVSVYTFLSPYRINSEVLIPRPSKTQRSNIMSDTSEGFHCYFLIYTPKRKNLRLKSLKIFLSRFKFSTCSLRQNEDVDET